MIPGLPWHFPGPLPLPEVGRGECRRLGTRPFAIQTQGWSGHGEMGEGLGGRPYSFWEFCSPLVGLLQLAAEVNVSSKVALGMSPRGTPILVLKRCNTLLGRISLMSG